jgi:hypothetical protein
MAKAAALAISAVTAFLPTGLFLPDNFIVMGEPTETNKSEPFFSVNNFK